MSILTVVTRTATLSAILFVAQPGSKAAEAALKKLQYSDVLQVIGCLQQSYPPVNLRPDYSGPTSFRVRYALGVEEISIHNGVVKKPEILVIVYGQDGKTAKLYELWPAEAETDGKFSFRNFGSLQRQRGRWALLKILQGGIGTYKSTQQQADELSKTPLRVIPHSAVTVPAETCWTKEW
jgi:hypothetical protein